ncbi:putative 40S ribosomal protein S15 [Iris pallida]|uniref:40S ribosomal protein S15 n=1 Tax=Iris pallida TaxID=29817 RepID=A0AAX6E159_IRIPA|nr:putative 40S ribosomal protein S15 [Iris pallida]
MIIVPKMIGSIIGVYNGKTFNQVEIKPAMLLGTTLLSSPFLTSLSSTGDLELVPPTLPGSFRVLHFTSPIFIIFDSLTF